MKQIKRPFSQCGTCSVCGRPTRVGSHVKCGQARDAEKATTLIGVGTLTKVHAEHSEHNQSKRRWAKGKILPWMA